MLLNQLFNNLSHIKLDLLEETLARRFKKNPASLISVIAAQKDNGWVVIDEVQRVPELLNVAHQLIENEKTQFALTGSSARKLKRGGANLLAGRAFVYRLYPLTSFELQNSFKLQDVLSFGSLPKIFSFATELEKKQFLNAYVELYVKEEIIYEQIIRQLEPFRDFLQVSAQMSTKVINHAKIAKEVGIDPKTVVTYFDILEDTLMGFRLPAYNRSVRKAQRVAPKFYWFDSGVRRALEDTLDYAPAPGTSYYGELFEEFLVNEIIRLNHYTGKNYRLSYFATHNSGSEIDLILQKGRGHEIILVEIKSSSKIDESEVKKLALLKADFPNAVAYYLSCDEFDEIIMDVRCMNWRSGLSEIFKI